MGHFTYLVLILAWAMPIIVVQWLMGLDILLLHWKVVVPGIFVPTLYLTVIDAFALGAHTWTINPEQSTGLFFPLIHVPVEEGLFFLVTNTLITQGLVYLWSPEMRQRTRLLLRVLRRGPGSQAGDKVMQREERRRS